MMIKRKNKAKLTPLVSDDAKGFKAYFRPFLDNYYWDTNTSTYSPDRNLILAMLPYMRDWYVQAGASGMNATDTLNRGAFMLGGNGIDTLIGGTGADLLVGNAANDTDYATQPAWRVAA